MLLTLSSKKWYCVVGGFSPLAGMEVPTPPECCLQQPPKAALHTILTTVFMAGAKVGHCSLCENILSGTHSTTVAPQALLSSPRANHPLSTSRSTSILSV